MGSTALARVRNVDPETSNDGQPQKVTIDIPLQLRPSLKKYSSFCNISDWQFWLAVENKQLNRLLFSVVLNWYFLWFNLVYAHSKISQFLSCESLNNSFMHLWGIGYKIQLHAFLYLISKVPIPKRSERRWLLHRSPSLVHPFTSAVSLWQHYLPEPAHISLRAVLRCQKPSQTHPKYLGRPLRNRKHRNVGLFVNPSLRLPVYESVVLRLWHSAISSTPLIRVRLKILLNEIICVPKQKRCETWIRSLYLLQHLMNPKSDVVKGWFSLKLLCNSS